MSGFHILQLSRAHVPEDGRITEETLYDNDIVNYYSDYIRDEINNPKERKEALLGLAEDLKGVAAVDIEEETVTFLDPDTVKETYRANMEAKLAELNAKARAGRLDDILFRVCGAEFRNNNDLIVLDDGGTMCLVTFIGNMTYPGERMFHVGAILNAHC